MTISVLMRVPARLKVAEIKRLMEKNEISSWSQLATLANISDMQAYRIRDSEKPGKKKANPTLTTLDKVAIALGVRVRDIIMDDTED